LLRGQFAMTGWFHARGRRRVRIHTEIRRTGASRDR
jgi:hypothetical protein